MMEKQWWYFTFCQKNSYLKNAYVRFFGTHAEAREQMVECFGDQWAFQYDETEFAGQPEKYGLKELFADSTLKNEILKPMVEDIDWLLNYARRVSQGQVTENDTKVLADIRERKKVAKGVCK